MNQKIVTRYSTDELMLAAAEYFFNFTVNSSKPLNICLSGGNTPKIFFTEIVESFADRIDWNNIRLWWGDERCVPPDHVESNYGITKKYLIDKLSMPEENIFRIKGEDNPEEEALRYAELMNSEIRSFNSVPQFDIIFLGLGEDGHTASIFPDCINLFYSDKNCVTTFHPESKQRRISITGRIINNAANIIFLVTGEQKSRIIKEIIANEETALKYPAALVRPIYGDIIWFLDSGAASKL
ncbi:MAG: 6-phosphogluconolactonase [Melioribacteraceae bacterium]|nr:6-phosphogluconolactonase [Melioribacteraceae bacterium]